MAFDPSSPTDPQDSRPAPAASTNGEAVEQSVPYTSGTEGYDTYRIPAVVRTKAGTLIAFAEARAGTSDTGEIVVVAKRSGDGGRTWGPLRLVAGDGTGTQGNPCPVADLHSGRVILLTCTNGADATETAIMAGEVEPADGRRVWVQHSDDDGATFSRPREITADVKHPDWRWYATGPGHAIALTTGPYRGRLVVPANHSTAPPAGSADTGTEPKYYGGHCLFSDDGGTTWHIGFLDDAPDGVVNANETTAAQLPDGRVYFNTRNQNGTAPGVRADALSADGGRTLLHPYAPQPGLAGTVVQGSVLQPAHGPLLFSGPADPARRAEMQLRASHDGGRTWSTVLTLSAQPAAYSDLVEITADHVGLLYETGPRTPTDTITFARIPLRPSR
ncbi:sialidase family protein [Actinacidiphila acididurans]|uniref:exo-alpha-sialidase n=1 Tax=Actinacidiphila acididurans TaxID=2784346 RepID=A0ABS2THZ5_9ACTN|nr:sialidase family protein [Actinacidiphila acididurans]MBM9502963.1 exo-alpha-sialidase [Actinacidiphila acididurans]